MRHIVLRAAPSSGAALTVFSGLAVSDDVDIALVPVTAFCTASPAASLTSYAASMAPVAAAAAERPGYPARFRHRMANIFGIWPYDPATAFLPWCSPYERGIHSLPQGLTRKRRMGRDGLIALTGCCTIARTSVGELSEGQAGLFPSQQHISATGRCGGAMLAVQ